MTIQETILSYPGLENTSVELMTKVLIVRELNATDDFSTDYEKTINLAIADLLVATITSSDYTENKLSEKLPRKEMVSAAIRLYRKNGEPESANDLVKGNFRIIGRAPKKW